jgi:F-type H+-transporting ATPase subunit alpha
MDVIDQILSIHAGTRGFLDDLPLARVPEFEEKLLKHYRDEFPEVREQVHTEGKMTDELDAKLKDIVRNFKKRFSTSSE